VGAWGVESADPGACSARLSLSATDPVTTADQTAKTTIYWHPFRGNRVSLPHSSGWREYSLNSVQSFSCLSTPNTVFDIFAAYVSGAFSFLRQAWTDDTTRATELTYQHGVPITSYNGHLWRYLGSARTTATTSQTEDSLTSRLLANYYNTMPRFLQTSDSTTHNYSGAFRAWNNDASHKVEYLIPVEQESLAQVFLHAWFEPDASGNQAKVAIGYDSGLSTVFAVGHSHSFTAGICAGARLGYLGYHYLTVAEYAAAASDFRSYHLHGSVDG